MQVKLSQHSQGGNRRTTTAKISLLTGLLEDGEGRAMVPTHTQKGNWRFRYYGTQPELVDHNTAWRVKAQDIEAIVLSQIDRILQTRAEVENLLQRGTYNAEQLHALTTACANLTQQLPLLPDRQKQDVVQRIIERVELHEGKVDIILDNAGLLTKLAVDQIPVVNPDNLIIECAAVKVRRGQELRLVIPPANIHDAPVMRDERLVTLIADARSTLALIKANPDKSVPAIASEHKRCRIRIGKLLNTELPLSWDEQKRTLGFA